ncbi:MAG: hypothetical protein ACYCXF_06640 [Thermoleophilia bacterium]
MMGSTGNAFSYSGSGNYWDNYDSPTEGCVNNAPFDSRCDGPYVFTGGSDANATVLRSMWGRRDWTWYDNVGGNDWVLLGETSNSFGFSYDLRIAGIKQPLSRLSNMGGPAAGHVSFGTVITNRYPGLMDGPVSAEAYANSYFMITSQRILWPSGGNSLEEVPGTDVSQLDYRMYWTWYDMLSPGYKDWILISNPNDYQINYHILIAGVEKEHGVIPAGGRVTPSFPGVRGGPVDVYALNDNGDPVYIMASQRVLSNGDMAFNEVPGQPAISLSDDYVWPWYDQLSAGTTNWVLVANKNGTPIYYQVWIAGIKVKDSGSIAPGGNDTPTFPGKRNGPVEVKCFSDKLYTVSATCIASQRSVTGPSFEEVPGKGKGSLTSSYNWTWYDQASPGATNWVLVANPSPTDTITATVTFTNYADHHTETASFDIAPGGHWTPTFAGKMGGPVNVRAVKQGTFTAANIITSQRVLWNGYFNEVWGQ